MKGIKTTVLELLKSDVTVDVYENTADDIGVAFCGDGENPLTEKGMKYFRPVLGLDVYVSRLVAHVDTDAYFTKKGIDITGYDYETRETTPAVVVMLIDLFWGLAGYGDPDTGHFKPLD